MASNRESLFGLNPGEQKRLLEQLKASQLTHTRENTRERKKGTVIPQRFRNFKDLPEYKQLQVHKIVAEKMEILNPFFTCHETKAKNTTIINNEQYINFATYDYLGLNGHPEILEAATDAMNCYGTSAGASRLVAGERPPHALLEQQIAQLYSADDAIVFVSGHATNVSTLHTLFGPRDAIYHDALAHNSIILGAVLSGAARYSFQHNNCEMLEQQLKQTRHNHERAIIVTEGLFSMDGSIANLPELIDLKNKYGCFIMIDEAHALGTLGATGRGCFEHFGIDPGSVDIWMGTLSKTLCGCGGFVAGCAEMVELLKYRAPGFIYSVGMSPPLAAASAKAIEIMLREPKRVTTLQKVSTNFLEEAKQRKLNTGHAEGVAVVPIIVGNSLVAGVLASLLFKRHINVLPIIYPVVEEGLARLRFFLSSEHTAADMATALDAILEELPNARNLAGQ